MRSSGRRGADSWSGDTIGESVQKTPGSDTRRQSCFFFFLVSDLSDLANPPGGTRPLFGCQVVKSDACRPLAGQDRRYWVLRATAAHQSRQTRGMAPDRTGSLPDDAARAGGEYRPFVVPSLFLNGGETRNGRSHGRVLRSAWARGRSFAKRGRSHPSHTRSALEKSTAADGSPPPGEPRMPGQNIKNIKVFLHEDARPSARRMTRKCPRIQVFQVSGQAKRHG
jgi:hypothetical protein